MIKLNQITPLSWKRFLIALLIVFIASAIRQMFFSELGRGIAYLTYYPAVMIAAMYGGFYSGSLATVISSLLSFYWIQKGYMSSVEWLAMWVFILSCIMISVISEATKLANRRALDEKIKAQNANHAKSAFLANMSHELRTPLNAILGYSELLQKETYLLPKHTDFLNIINRSGAHLLALINDVLEISKIETKRTTLNPINFNIRNLIRDLEKMFELTCKSKGLNFKIMLANEFPTHIISDEIKLRIILINLIGNAAKFTQKGSIKVSLSIDKTDNKDLYLLVEVKDTGPGIADEEKDKLFKYFAQTESGKQAKSGTGLGLAISQDYAKVMDGKITCTSTLGSGSTFKVRIKIKEGNEEDIKSESNNRVVIRLADNQKIPKILIAEDNQENRRLLVNILQPIGFEIREAVDGNEAVEISQQWKPDFIWMDVRMPVMDGLEAARIIKASKHGKQTKIAAISAHVLGTDRNEIFEAGCDDFTGKPFKINELFEIMGKHLDLKYVYEGPPTINENEIVNSNLALNFKDLDIALISDLKKAIDSTDAIKILKIAEQLKTQDPELAKALTTCAKNFDYEPIRKALLNETFRSDKV
jgi:signal transduction histidine kinase/FixJ family two-component response regulator